MEHSFLIPEDKLIQQATSYLTSAIGKNLGVKIIKTFFTEDDKELEQLIKKALQKLDKHYKNELFGGNLVNIFLQPTSIGLLKRFIDYYDYPEFSEFSDEIDVDRLPPDFYEKLKSFVLEKLYQSKTYKTQIIDHLHQLKTDNSHDDIKEIKQIVLQLISQNNSRIETPVSSELPIRNKYPEVDHYIPRTIIPIQQEIAISTTETKSLIELIEKEHRIMLLSPAGIGKSIELKNLASHYSAFDAIYYSLLISLNTYTNEEIIDLIEREFANSNQIPPDQLLLIFDGLDEIHTNYFEAFIAKLSVYSRKNKETRIVITCRDNFVSPFFNSPTKSGFSLYKLKSLSYWDVTRYARKRLSEPNAEVFLKIIHELKLLNIVESPFFLSYLIEAFNRNKNLPNSKVQIFEDLIKHRIEEDKQRFALKGIKVDKNIVRIKTSIERLALIMESTGKNYITNDELEEVIPSLETREYLEHTFLFNKSNKENWQFDHNNFQEYLAGKWLSKKKIEDAKKLIGLPPKYTVIKPSWVNTVSFLFILLTPESDYFKKLLKWLLKVDKELLLRFEKERVDLAIREKVFIEIIKDYDAKGIRVRSENFDLYELVKFVSESRHLFYFLFTRITTGSTGLIIGDTVQMLPFFNYVNEYKEKLLPELEEIIHSSKQSELKYAVIRTLVELQWTSKESFNRLLPSLSIKSQYGRASIYKYLSKSGFINDYVDIVLSSINFKEEDGVFVNKIPSQKKVKLGDESTLRQLCLLTIDSDEGITKLLQFAIDQWRISSLHSISLEFLSNGFLDKVGEYIKRGNNKMLKDVVILFSLLPYHHRRKDSPFIAFFESTNTVTQASFILLNMAKSNPDLFASLSKIADKEFIHVIVSQYEKGELTDADIINFRNNLNWISSIHFELFYKLINDLSGNKFKIIDEAIDWSALRKRRQETDLNLLADQNSFIKGIEYIFYLEGKDTITKEDLWDYKKAYVDDEHTLDNTVILDSLRHHDKTLSKNEMITYYQEYEQWEWFKISTLIDYDINHVNNLGDREIQFIRSWCQRKIEMADFKTALTSNSYRYLETYLAYCITRFDLEFDESVYLDLLWINSNLLLTRRKENSNIEEDENEKLDSWVITKVSIEKTTKRVLQNLSSDAIQNSSVYLQHIRICVEYNLVESLPVISKIIHENQLKSYELIQCCDYYLQLGGNIQDIEKILEDNKTLDKFDRFKIIELLINNKSKKITSYLIDNLNKGNEELELTYAKHLMELGKVEGLQYYLEWMTKHKKFDDYVNSKLFTLLPLKQSVPLLLGIVDLYFSQGFDREYLHNQDQELLATICSLASTSQKEYEMVKLKFEEHLMHQDGKQLYYYLRRLDALYHANLGQTISVKEIAALVDKM